MAKSAIAIAKESEALANTPTENPIVEKTTDPNIAPVVDTPVQAPEVQTPEVQAPVEPVEQQPVTQVAEKQTVRERIKAKNTTPEKPIMSDREEFELGESKKQVTQQEKQAKLEWFRQLMEENADRAEMARYVNENPDLRTQFGYTS